MYFHLILIELFLESFKHHQTLIVLYHNICKFGFSVCFSLLNMSSGKKSEIDQFRNASWVRVGDDCYNMLAWTNYELFEFEHVSRVTIAFWLPTQAIRRPVFRANYERAIVRKKKRGGVYSVN